MGSADDFISALLTEGPLASRCELVRTLPTDDFGPRVLARQRRGARVVTVRGFAIADAAWCKASRRLQALSRVSHDKVARLVAYGRHEGLAYFLHEHNGGKRLTSVLKKREQLPFAEVLPLAIQILMGVGDAHRRGLVLGGIRPQDIRLHQDADHGPSVEIRNLGLAAVLGVPAGRQGVDQPTIYRAPETDIATNPRSDVFSLGVMFIRMLTGALPLFFTEEHRRSKLQSRLERAQEAEPPLPEPVARLLLRAVDFDPERRPCDANQFLAALLQNMPMPTDAVPVGATSLGDAVTQPWRCAERSGLQEPPLNTSLSASASLTKCTVVSSRTALVRPPRHDPEELEPPSDVDVAEWSGYQSVPQVSSAELEVSEEMLATSATTQTYYSPPSSTVRVPAVSRLRPLHLALGLTAVAVLSAAVVSLLLLMSRGEPSSRRRTDPTSAEPSALAARALLPAARPSTLIVNSDPPGRLTIDGDYVGTTPYQGAVRPGVHLLRVEAEGYASWRSRAMVGPQQTRRLAITLARDGKDL